MSDSWYYTENGQQAGPVDESTLRQLAAMRRLQPHDLIWRQGMAQWTAAREALPNLFGGAAAPAPAATAPPPPPVFHAGPGAPLNYQGVPPPGGYAGAPQVDPALKFIVPIGATGWSIAAGYLGLFSLVCAFLGPVAVIVSIVALNDLKKRPGVGGKGRAITGLVLGILTSLAAIFFVVMMVLEA